jgi:uncharacterized protein YegP (UPF0339 family)
VYRGEDGDWRWRLVGLNSEIVASGEGYASKSNALRAVRRMKAEVWRAKVEAP